MKSLFENILARLKRVRSRDPFEEQFSVRTMEIKMEKKLAYILRLLSVSAFQKSNRKSLPTNEKITMNCEGPLITKLIQQWEQEFIQIVVRKILNQEIQKMRFYIHIELNGSRRDMFSKGKYSITLFYFIHTYHTLPRT